MPSEVVRLISLGWGVQSFTLAAMSALGELPRVDVAIHADSTHERTSTYRFARQWTPWLQEHGVRVATVTAERAFALEQKRVKSVIIPAFTWYNTPEVDPLDECEPTGNAVKTRGQLRRQCTQRWKIRPMRRWLRANYPGGRFEMWLGISADEIERARPSDVRYIGNRFPLLEKRMAREDCKRWLISHGLGIPTKSSCVFCPYHSAGAWRELKASGGGDWAEAVRADELIRSARPPFDLYVHSSRKPLAEIGDGIDAQPSLFAEECTGYCFL